jgi:hypothetical protein
MWSSTLASATTSGRGGAGLCMGERAACGVPHWLPPVALQAGVQTVVVDLLYYPLQQPPGRREERGRRRPVPCAPPCALGAPVLLCTSLSLSAPLGRSSAYIAWVSAPLAVCV